jgi:NADPH-dependent curcumin reductase CurA
MTSREIRLASRPVGVPTAANFTMAEVELPAIVDGQALVRNRYMSVDPYMRGRMNDVKSYVPPFQVGAPLDGGAIGEVVESRLPDLSPGAIVQSNRGWREFFVAEARDVRVIDRPLQPLSIYLGALGMTGFTAWVGLSLADLKPGEHVFVSAAAGAVGSVAGQLAKIRGGRVVGSAGSAEKVRIVRDEFGFDAAFNYKDGHLGDQLRAAAAEGLDVYFDNVGGDHLEAALSAMRVNGRVIACGAISRYNATGPVPGPGNYFLIVTKRLTIRGFIVSDWTRRLPEFLAEVTPYVADGRLRWRETVVDGLARAPEALISLFTGENVGKMVVKLT